MTSVERTAYPVFPRLMMARELYTYFSPSEEELAWVREKTDTDEHQLALALALNGSSPHKPKNPDGMILVSRTGL